MGLNRTAAAGYTHGLVTGTRKYRKTQGPAHAGKAPEYSTKTTVAQTVRSVALLPHLTRPHPSTTMRPVPPRQATTPNARVLIVDDDASVTEVFARMLRLEGFEVWAAHSADEGLALAQTHRPHAVILDLRVPLASGVQVLRALRGIPGMQHTPVTIVTGDYYLAESQTSEIQSLGADVRFKPLWLDELVTLARDMLHTPVRTERL